MYILHFGATVKGLNEKIVKKMQKLLVKSKNLGFNVNMLLKYEFSNFRSVGKDPISIDFEASAEKLHNEVLIDGKANKACFIFGENGVGKSSIVYSFEKLRDMVHRPILNHDRFVRDQQHVLYKNCPSTYEVTFTKNGVKYIYSLSYLNSEILAESLYYSPNGRTTKVFTRGNELESLSFSPAFEKDAKNCGGYFRSSRLILSIAANVTQIQPIIDACSFFDGDILRFLDDRPNSAIVQRVGEFLTENPHFKELFLKMLKDSGFDIEDIIIESYTEEPRRYPTYEEPDDYFESRFSRSRVVFDVFVKHPQFTLPLKEESHGTLNLMRILIAFCRVMNEEKVMLCDEPETSIHPNLFRELVRMFMDSGYNTNSQMLCATHATEILDLKMLRRDQLYFASMNSQDRSTCLTRLSDMNGIRKTDNIEKAFLAGEYSQDK